MTYVDLLKSGADETDLKKHLADGEQVAVTVRIPKNLRDAAKQSAALDGTSFSAMVRIGLIDQLISRH